MGWGRATHRGLTGPGRPEAPQHSPRRHPALCGGMPAPILQRKTRPQRGDVLAEATKPVRNRAKGRWGLGERLGCWSIWGAHPCRQQSRFSFSSEQLS